jgi:hypothetical protein
MIEAVAQMLIAASLTVGVFALIACMLAALRALWNWVAGPAWPEDHI